MAPQKQQNVLLGFDEGYPPTVGTRRRRCQAKVNVAVSKLKEKFHQRAEASSQGWTEVLALCTLASLLSGLPLVILWRILTWWFQQNRFCRRNRCVCLRNVCRLQFAVASETTDTQESTRSEMMLCLRSGFISLDMMDKVTQRWY